MFTWEKNQYNNLDIIDEKGNYVATIINNKVNHVRKNLDSNDLRKLADALDLINPPII